MFVDSLQFSMAGRGQTCDCEEVRGINPCGCLSIIAVCCPLHFTSGSTIVIFPHALSDQSKSSLGNAFKDTSSQQVKRMLSRNCILVRFTWFGPEWCEKEPKRLKIATTYNILPLVRTKASELSDFPGVNTLKTLDYVIALVKMFHLR